jgi:hypothetical protein
MSQSAAGGEQKRAGMESLFEVALIATGADYVRAERELRRLVASGHAQTLAVITAGARHPDPLAPLLVEVLLAARGPSAQDYDNLEKLFQNMPARTARTPVGEPEPQIFQMRVTRAYGSRVTKFLALRLAKEPMWPEWLALGVLVYLEEHADPATVPAILRFAIVTPVPERRAWARETLQKIADPALEQKLADAQRWAEGRKLPIPLELRGIGSAR